MTTTERTGWELVTAAQAGDLDAFGELWTRYRIPVACYIGKSVRNWSVTEDLTSDTFLRAFRGIGAVRDQGNSKDVLSWLTTIARNIVIDHSRRNHTRLSMPVADFLDDRQQLPATEGPDVIVPEQRAAADVAARLDRLVSRLTANQQKAIRHRFYDGLSIAETAALMGCRTGAMRGAQHLAVTNLALACAPARTSVEFVDGVRA